jgi:hypothetical protein
LDVKVLLLLLLLLLMMVSWLLMICTQIIGAN